MRASIHIAPADPQQAAAEIDRLGDHPGVAQVMMPAGSLHPFGNRIYHPIYEACERNGLPMCVPLRRRGRRLLRTAHRSRLPHLLPRDAYGPPPDRHGPYRQPYLRRRLRKVSRLQVPLHRARHLLGAPASCGTWTPTGRACATTRPGSSACPANTCASTSASAPSPSPTCPNGKDLETYLDWLHADEDPRLRQRLSPLGLGRTERPHAQCSTKNCAPRVMYDNAAELYGLN